MQYKELINIIKNYVENYRVINSFENSDIYDATDKDNIKYPLFVLDDTSTHNISNPISEFNFQFHYVDRLLDDGSNLIDIKNDSLKVFNDLVLLISETDDMDVKSDEVQCEFFKGEFRDYCAGNTLTLTVKCVTNDWICDIIK